MEVSKIRIESRYRGSFEVDSAKGSIKDSVSSGIQRLGFGVEDVHFIHGGRMLKMFEDEHCRELLENSAANDTLVHIITKTSVEALVNFKVSGCGVKGNITFSCGGSVISLKEEIFHSFQPQKVSSPEGIKLILKGKSLLNNELVGEYTGTLMSKPQHLLVMFDPIELAKKKSGKDVTLKVKLPNKKDVTFDIAPATPFLGVKTILHKHFNAPEPESFELYCSQSRKPLANQIHKLDKILKGMGVSQNSKSTDSSLNDTDQTIGDILTSSTSVTGNTMELLLLPTQLLQVNGVTLLVTSDNMLNKTFPVALMKSKRNTSSESKSIATKQVPVNSVSKSSSNMSKSDDKDVTVQQQPLGPKPSRPAAHPKERKSKSRKGFAGLKRGFFTPEKKKKAPLSENRNRDNLSEPSTMEKAVLLAAASVSNTGGDSAVACKEVGPMVLNFEGEGSPEIEKKIESTTPKRNKYKSRPTNRCQVCSKKLLAWDMAAGQCRCGGLFCSKHGHFAEHNCAFDFATYEKDQLRARSTAGVSLTSRNYSHI